MFKSKPLIQKPLDNDLSDYSVEERYDTQHGIESITPEEAEWIEEAFNRWRCNSSKSPSPEFNPVEYEDELLVKTSPNGDKDLVSEESVPQEVSASIEDRNYKMTLLNRINKISERLEQESDNLCNSAHSSIHELNRRYLPYGIQNDSDMTQMSTELFKEDEDDRIKELYRKVFPSQKIFSVKQNKSYFKGSPQLNSGHNETVAPFSNENTRTKSAKQDNGRVPITEMKYPYKVHSQMPAQQYSNFRSKPLTMEKQIDHSPYREEAVLPHVNHRMDRLCITKPKEQDSYNNRALSKRNKLLNRDSRSRDDKRYSQSQCIKLYKQCRNSCDCTDDLTGSSSSTDNEIYEECNHKKFRNHKKKKITVDELYKIVKLQNEQITLLQKQIDRLLENYSKNDSKQNKEKHLKTIKPCSCNNGEDKYSSREFTLSVTKENSKIESQRNDCDNKTSDLPNVKQSATNVSIGVMTSFVEIMQKVQTQHNVTGNSCGMNKMGHDLQSEIPRQRGRRSADTSVKRSGCPAVAEESFTLNEIDLPALPEVVEEPTPQCSLHIDMQDYGSTTTTSISSNTSDCEEYQSDPITDDQDPVPEEGSVGWTLYDNVVGQINKILQHNDTNKADDSNSAVNGVRTATLQQLKKLGVSFVDNDMSVDNKRVVQDRMGNRFGNHPDDHNAKTNAICTPEAGLPMEYLNENQILQAAMQIMSKRNYDASALKYTAPNAITPPSNGNVDLSFATMKYMERYCLLPDSDSKGKNSGDKGQQRQLPADRRSKNISKRPSSKSKEQNGHRSRKQYQNQHYPQPQCVGGRWPQPMSHIPHNEHRPQNQLSNKILDITALKQQPKLL